MSLEWFDRVSGELQDHLESICDKYDQVGHMSIDRGAKHPRIEFYVETDDDGREYFCSLFYDPHNEEFYTESYDLDLEHTSRTILTDIDDLIDAVHESFHDYMNEEDIYVENEELYMDDEYIDEGYELDNEFEEGYYEEDYSEAIENEIEVEWITPEVTAYSHEDEVNVTYQFGVVQETGDGILRRFNRVITTEDSLIEDESNFIFSKDEAGTIISMIASNMDSLSDFDFE
ncbi:hypothetical protein [Pseudalkalibacillus caeni]|uniref:Uncharacterized protein n=1 Tax=Exobacillus caeni TaxID=2574798 RepID=A0A5R9F5D9_9BACL|nr:hypothetical protein [Pseudalkalibacillus caeni]TLS35025.1 hypothetical protein FCL54_22460 [Pseudalkalibacillus caeni]